MSSQKSIGYTSRNPTQHASSATSLTGRKKSSTVLTASSRKKRGQKSENLRRAITELFNYFYQRNVDAIIRVIRTALEKIRRRIVSTSAYGKQENHNY